MFASALLFCGLMGELDSGWERKRGRGVDGYVHIMVLFSGF